MLRPERYEGEHADLRFEYSRDAAAEELERLRREAGCDDQCPADCRCVTEMLEDEQERRDQERDFARSRGI